MRPIAKGTSTELEFVVDEEMRARFGGRTVHAVLSTSALVHHMEWAARELLEPALDEGEEGVGAGVDVHHLAPAMIGDAVRVRAVAQASSRSKLVCAVEARVGARVVARGTVYQAIWPKEDLRTAMASGGAVRSLHPARPRMRSGQRTGRGAK